MLTSLSQLLRLSTSSANLQTAFPFPFFPVIGTDFVIRRVILTDSQTFRAFSRRVTATTVGYNYTAKLRIAVVGLAPTRPADSSAAPILLSQTFLSAKRFCETFLIKLFLKVL